ncbi:hypothetical protein ACP275_04G228300 [Erythranthe tilingii]
MAQRASAPQFGMWDEGSVPYTVYFEKARKNKGVAGKMINPNDPQENPDMFLSASTTPSRRESVRPTDGGDFRQFGNSSTRSEKSGLQPVAESNYGGRGGAQRPARSTRPSLGSEKSFENSPLHPSGRGGGGGPHLVTREGTRSNTSSAHGTPARPRPRPARVDESPERSPAVPTFGGWNENNPESAENFTYIFEHVRHRKNIDAGNAPVTPKRAPPPRVIPRHNKPSNKSNKWCCCPWW